ncbi:hypothetical protein BDV28DRAFT_157027 [Aspergillus coremiiformis]|uniref:BZIP domain-containing protein n=1 Tax=Aspergillus coremiiformis TaxID=138285 RepID=A0A5N6Z741_9EURO|nr:hypothetical protein BDV28DRAFT_157027 [Aspergillus coremiiformis]
MTSACELPIRASQKGPDDWSGLTDAKERRRRQNRINQRAYRQRKRAKRREATVPTEDTESPISSQSPQTTLTIRKCPSADQTVSLLDLFSKTAYQSYILGSPTSDHLLTLSRVNVFRAFATIMSILGMYPHKEWMHDDAISPFTTLHPGYVSPTSLPPALRPTAVQQSIPHHPWLDFFPHPRMRDNLIRAGDAFDDEQLCIDIMGFWDVSTESCGLLVWGDPQDPESWEVSEEFIRKWPWVLWGCGDLLVSTNRWRAMRGEKLIFRYL